MGNYTLVVFTNPVEGREDDYNEWYDNQHLGDVIAAAGFDRAERLRLTDIGTPSVTQHRYLALYQVETDDPESVFKGLIAAAGTDAMPMSDAIDLSSASMGLFETISQRRAGEA
jgi:hypothetical protein